MRDRSPQLTRRALLGSVGAVGVAGCLDQARTPARSAEDWPMAGGDPGQTGYAPAATPPRTEPTVAWERTPDPATRRSPIVANGTLYYQTSDTLFVLDPKTGEGKTVDTFGAFEGTGPPAFAPSEAYRDGMYIVPYGRELAAYPAARETWPGSIPDDGRQRMRWASTGPPLTTGKHPVDLSSQPTTPPIPVVGTVVFETGARVRAVDADDGSLVWQRTPGAQFSESEPDRRRLLVLVVDQSREIVITTYPGSLDTSSGIEGLHLRDGSPVWGQRLESNPRTAVASDGALFLSTAQQDGGQSSLVSFSTADGAQRWRRSFAETDRVGLAVDDTHCYHLGAVGSEDATSRSRLTAVARTDGTTAWEREFGEPGASAALSTSLQPTVGGDVVFAPGREAIYAFDTTTGERLWDFSKTVSTAGGSRVPRSPLTPVVPVGDRLISGMTLGLYGLEER